MEKKSVLFLNASIGIFLVITRSAESDVGSNGV